MKKSLIVGMGFGQAVYKPVLVNLGYQVITVDPLKDADYKSVQDAIADHGQFDTVNICTPNCTHESIAREVAPYAKVVFVEKPGVVNSDAWKNLVIDFPATRIAMVKNNQYRDQIAKFKELAESATQVTVRWNSKNRIPNPGSWFTTKDLSFGGVSRDLIPHMLSYYCVLTNYKFGNKLYSNAVQRHSLVDLVDTDYGIVNHDGIYNVDDFCEFEFKNGNTTWILTANWKDNIKDDSSISFETATTSIRFELGLCPEQAYQKMIESAITNLNNDDYWKQQLAQDLWIHKQIENL
jgi:predicted dehydrogenase